MSLHMASLGNAQARIDAPPAEDETLIYVIRVRDSVRPQGVFYMWARGIWLAVNDQRVASLRNYEYAVVRAKAGLISMNLSGQRMAFGHFNADDRPGETIYLAFDTQYTLVEVPAERGRALIGAFERAADIDAPLDNPVYHRALMSLSALGFDLMQPASGALEPDEDTAVVTFFRQREKDRLDVSVWDSEGYLGNLKTEESFQARLAPGDHHFVSAGYTGTQVLRATLEAGKRYYVLVDVVPEELSVRLRPVGRADESRLSRWLRGTTPVELNEEALTAGRVEQRIELVKPFVRQTIEQTKNGPEPARALAGEHAF